jgi:hypothetical protein
MSLFEAVDNVLDLKHIFVFRKSRAPNYFQFFCG